MGELERAFEIVEIPATGAYGTVCVARVLSDPNQRLVALKVLKTDHVDRPRIAARTRDEARILMKLDHPNIVRVEQLLQLAGRPVLMMEWVEGVPLSKLILDHEGTIPLEVVLEIGRQTARALHHAYEGANDRDGKPLRIVHRDIKPSNILLSTLGNVKVVDFGIARAEFADREISTSTTAILGSQGYIAPERLTGAADTPTVDVYALGVTLFELVVRKHLLLPLNPIEHRKLLDAALDELDACVDEPRRAPLRSLFRRMIATDRDERPQLIEVVAELEAQLAAGPPPDMAAFARDAVKPLYENRRRTTPALHPDYGELGFLERTWDVLTSSPQGERDPAADRKVRRFLQREDWARKKSDLYWLLATHSDWTEAPFLEILDGAKRKWWKFWEAEKPPGEVALALQVLRHRLSADVLARARLLVDHPSREVADAAKELVGLARDQTG